jgi:hypothetical protein
MLENSLVAERLEASEERLSSMELVHVDPTLLTYSSDLILISSVKKDLS